MKYWFQTRCIQAEMLQDNLQLFFKHNVKKKKEKFLTNCLSRLLETAV